MAPEIIFSDAAAFAALLGELPAPSVAAGDAARARQGQLTKPPGSLGRLEDLAIWFAGWQGREIPRLERAHCLIFAGNHGVAAKGVSAFPAEVTAQMVANFEHGGAAINQLCRVAGAELSVTALELDQPTADFTEAPAMSAKECLAALQAGADAVPGDAEVVLLGEMGIANTTAAAALALACFGGTATDWVGPGTGVDAAGLARKADVVTAALARHGAAANSSFECLRRVGGRELAAIAGATLAARHRRIPVILDGFIATAAAAVLRLDQPAALEHAVIAHCSAEPGHRKLLDALAMEAILDLGLRLGEASGAALALMLLRAAIATHAGMATFADAGVSNSDA
jgi:nicotinate-nucleotide--dimethylbenzimidazole phosphoribosyltransferase